MPIATRQLGTTDAHVTELGYGGAPLGDLFQPVTDAKSRATLRAAWQAGIRYYDTSPWYGYGKSELRMGEFLRQKSHGSYVVSTKVGRVFKATRDLKNFEKGFWCGGLPFDHTYDYSYDGIMRSYEDSLIRFGIHRVDLLLIHDLDPFYHNEAQIQAYLHQLFTSGWRALAELKASGDIKGVGAGLNKTGMMLRFLELMPLDFFIVAMPYTLLDQDALDLELPRCVEDGIGIVIGAVFASGILVTGPTESSTYGYMPATPEILEKTRRIQAVCERHGVPLAAAALQFPLFHPAVASVIPGAIKPEYVESNITNYEHPIPVDLWAELKSDGLIREDAPTPG